MARSHHRTSRSPRGSQNGRGRDQRSWSPDRYRSRSREHRRHRSETRDDLSRRHRDDSRNDRSRRHRSESRNSRSHHYRRESRDGRPRRCGYDSREDNRRDHRHDQPARNEPLPPLLGVDIEDLEIAIGDTKFAFRRNAAPESAATEIDDIMVARLPGHVHGIARRQTHAVIDDFFDKFGDDVSISLMISVNQNAAAKTSEPSAATAPSDRPGA